jgi:hypothetical protein
MKLPTAHKNVYHCGIVYFLYTMYTAYSSTNLYDHPAVHGNEDERNTCMNSALTKTCFVQRKVKSMLLFSLSVKLHITVAVACSYF